MKKLLFVFAVCASIVAMLAVCIGTGFIQALGFIVIGFYVGLGLNRLEQILLGGDRNK